MTFIISSNLTAQYKNDFRFSLVLNPQLSWIKSDHEFVSNKSSKFGYNFGLVMDRFFGHNYAFSTGLTINTTGGKLGYKDEIGIRETIDYRLKYLEIPLGLKLRSEDIRRTNIYGRFGLSPQVNIQARDKNGNSISSKVKLLELSYHLGGGIEYSLGGKNALIFGLLFNNGFTDISKHKGIRDKAILNRLTFEFGFIF